MSLNFSIVYINFRSHLRIPYFCGRVVLSTRKCVMTAAAAADSAYRRNVSIRLYSWGELTVMDLNIKVPLLQTVIDCKPLSHREGAPRNCRGGQNGAQVKHTFEPRPKVYTWVKKNRPVVDRCIDDAVRQRSEFADIGFVCKRGVDRSVAALNLVKEVLVKNGYNVEAFHLTNKAEGKACTKRCCFQAHQTGPHGQEWEEVLQMFYNLWQEAVPLPHDVGSESKVARGALYLQEQAACVSWQKQGGMSIQTQYGREYALRDYSPESKSVRARMRLQEQAERKSRIFMHAAAQATGSSAVTQPAPAASLAFIPPSALAAQVTGSSAAARPAPSALPAFTPPQPPFGDGEWQLYSAPVTGRLWWHNLRTEECRWHSIPFVSPPDGNGCWRLYSTPVTAKLWWYNELTEEWTWGGWRLYRAPVTDKLWWYNEITEEWRWQEVFVK